MVLTEDPPIYVHIQRADSEKVRELLTGDKDLIKSRDGRGGTPLRRAAFEGSIKIVELLFEFGARVEDVDHLGWTPLHAAAYSGHAIVVELLIARGANVNATDNEGRTPLMLAAHQGHLGALCVLLRNGANTDIQARSGASALMLAANCSECLVVQELLHNGARTDLRNQKNKTVLQQMQASQHQEVIDLLRGWEHESRQSNKPKVNTGRLYESDACDSGAADAGPSSFALETSHTPDAEKEGDEEYDFSPFDRLVSCVLPDSDDE